jgi:hypothetical protein
VTSGRGLVATASTVVFLILLPIPVAASALTAILTTAASNQAEQRQSSHRGEAQFEESLAAHAAPPSMSFRQFYLRAQPNPRRHPALLPRPFACTKAPEEATAKVLRRRGEFVGLEARNGAHEDIVVPAERVAVQGTVEWVIWRVRGRK